MHSVALLGGDRALQIHERIMVVFWKIRVFGIVLEYYDEGQ